MPTRLTTCLLLAGCAAVAAISAIELRGQPAALDRAPAQEPGTRFPKADRRDVRLYKAAVQQLADGRIDEAIVYLQTILDQKADGFFEADDSGRLVSLRSECVRCLEELTGDARTAYTLRYEPAANALLSDAIAAHDVAQLAAVARRFPATSAGRKATYHLALSHIDRGEDLAAVARLERLRPLPEFRGNAALLVHLAGCCVRIGDTDRQKKILNELAGLEGHVAMGGDRVATTDEAGLRERLESPTDRGSDADSTGWRVAGGDPGRTNFRAETTGPSFSWTTSSLSDPFRLPDGPESPLNAELQRWSAQTALLKLSAGWPAAPTARPVAVDETVFVRTPSQLIALDLERGEHRWRSLADPLSWDYLKDDVWESAEGELAARTFVGQRLWSDANWGTPSTDGQVVFAVEETGATSPLPAVANDAQSGKKGPIPPDAFNRLVAYEATTGRRVWEAGGPAGHDLPCAGTFFYGAPVPAGGQWFALGESGGVSQLMAFDVRQRDSLLWTLPVAEHDRTIDHDVVRRAGGLSPCLAGGLLICPLGTDLVVAVDPAARSACWAWRPPAIADEMVPRRRPSLLSPVDNSHAPLEVVVADRRVLIASPATGVTAVDAVDGGVLWSSTEFAGLWMIGSNRDCVFLQTLTGVAALRLDDGLPAWTSPAVIGNPSGRGVIVGDRLYIPLAEASLAVLDVETGRLLDSRAVPRNEPIGNLIVVGETLLSQSATHLDAMPIDGTSE